MQFSPTPVIQEVVYIFSTVTKKLEICRDFSVHCGKQNNHVDTLLWRKWSAHKWQSRWCIYLQLLLSVQLRVGNDLLFLKSLQIKMIQHVWQKCSDFKPKYWWYTNLPQ
jgi:hypothetical protein